MSPLKSKTVLITGASSGIGEALARECASRGANLVLVARRADRIDRLAHEIRDKGGRAIAVTGDVTCDGELERAAEIARKEFGAIDVVVANAGFGVNGLAEELTLGDYRRQFETNVYGVLRTFYATLADLKVSKGSFTIVGSVSGHVSAPTTSAYAMSKFAVRALADALRAELKRYGVAVTLISPGFVKSDIRVTDNRGSVHRELKDPVPDWLQMPSEKAARKIVRAILCRRRERVLTVHGHLAVWLQRACPAFVNWVLGLAKVKTRQERLNQG
ncbi:MAG TPA: SDR family NAD(P)-dependent oxidoreductase [bacterium]|nr:SDR family NAD(P)-dependent oxidoreductase [bacterium]